MFDPRTKKDEIEKRFHENFEKYNDIGASVSIWFDGGEVINFNRGQVGKNDKREWTKNTVCPIWSATKAASAAAFLVALDNAGLDPEDLVEETWPTLHAAQGTGLTFSHVLSHQAGLAMLDKRHRGKIESHASVVAGLEKQKPNWAPGTAHGYHPRTYGFILDELMRRIGNIESLAFFWRDRIADPNGIDFWMMLPEEEELLRSKLARVEAPTTAMKNKNPEEKDFYKELKKVTSLSSQAFASPTGLKTFSEINKVTVQRLGNGSLGGMANATGLAKFYAIIANNGKWWSRTVFSKTVQKWMKKIQVNGDDKVLKMKTSFTNGFMADPVARIHKSRSIFGPEKGAIGHPGAGGTLGFADPENKISFAFVANQMHPGVLPDNRAMSLVEALYA